MDNDALIKYLNHHSSPEERAAVEAWVQADPENEAYLRKLKKVWEIQEEKPEVPDVDEAWHKVRHSIQVTPQEKRLQFRVWQAAAAVGLLVIAFGIWYQQKAVPMVVINRTDQADALEVALPDGSIVWLNRNSTLRFPKRFKGRERRVELEGEAFFEVQRNEAKPFRVETDKSLTEVLGTSFDLMAYPDSARQWIQVHTGMVAFSAKNAEGQTISLQKEEGAILDHGSQSVSAMPNWKINALAWKSRTFRFDNSLLAEVVRSLEAVYGVEIKLENPALSSCRLNATYQDESLEEILNSITLLFGLEQDRNNNIITLSGESCD